MNNNEIVAVDNSTVNNSVTLIKDEKTLKEENSQGMLVVKEVLHNKPNPVMVNGKRHLEFEDWIALGNAYGVTVSTGDAEPVEIFEAKGFKAKAKVIRVIDGLVIGGAEAYCLDNERNWKNRDYFQMASMAQTRAGSKALSNALRGVVALDKTLNGTPGEEMNGVKHPVKPTSSKPKPSKPVTNNANLGNKPKPKPSAPSKPKVDDEAIEVEATEVKEPKTMSFKEICDSNPSLTMAVNELSANGITVNTATVHDKLMDLWDIGKITDEEYQTAKKLLE